MINQLSKTKAWAEFVEWWQRRGYGWWIDDNGTFYSDTNRTASNLELLSLLVDFCDSEGYYIQPNCFPQFKAWNVSIMSGNINVCQILRAESGRFQDYDSRTEATQAAIKKCFELMEGK